MGPRTGQERQDRMAARIDQVVTAGVNTWIIGDDEEVIVVDPGTDAEAVLAAAGEREVLAVICTHGHAGHATAAFEVAERDEAPVAVHNADRLSWREVHGRHDPDIEMEDGGVFEVADVTLEVIHTPGHSAGSVCLYCEELGAVFCGDLLAADGPVTQRGRLLRLRAPAQLDRREPADAGAGDPGAARARRGDHRGRRGEAASTPG